MTSTTSNRGPGAGVARMRAVLAAWAAAIVVLVVAAAPATAADSFGIVPGSFSATVSTDQAGAYPDATTDFTITTDADGAPVESVKDIVADLPQGLVGNPQAMPKCEPGTLVATLATLGGGCPLSTQVGRIGVKLSLPGVGGYLIDTIPVFNMVPRAGRTAEFGFFAISIPVFITASVRADGSLRTVIPSVFSGLPLIGTTLTLWGDPASSAHDAQRGETCVVQSWDGYSNCSGGGHGAGVEPRPFMRNPTECGKPGAVTLTVNSWENPARKVSATSAPTTMTGCDRLRFDAGLRVRPNAAVAGSPSGFAVNLTVTQADRPDGFAAADLKRAVVTLPEGVRVNPAAASGLQGCSIAQIGLDDVDDPTCPQASKIGSVQIDTPLLDTPMTGGIYLAAPHANPFDSLLAIYLVAQGSDVTIKLPGRVEADPATGQLTATFDDNPQLPFSQLTLHFSGGARAPLTTPDRCGTFTTTAELTAWSGQVVRIASPMQIDQGCETAGRFTPSLSAGTTNPVAGASSPFVLRFARPDGQQELGAVNGSLPPGLLGVLASVPLCRAAQGAAGTCPASSIVGHAQVAAGAGVSPVWLPVAGRPANAVYLTEPYRPGDVAGMSVVVPAVAGPFDLGTVVTKVYLKLRPKDQGIDLQSDRLPRILQGIPLQLRDVAVTIDRKGFMVNPTDCSAMATYTNVFSQSWAKVPVTARFQVGGCGNLGFSPIVAAQAGGKGNVKRYQHPALEVTVRQPAGQAHLDKAYVVLPKALNIDLKAPALKAACPRDVYAKDRCSPVATIGTVRAVTPLLREALSGPAFLIQKKGKLPDIVMRLRNNRMSLDLIGVLDFLEDGRLITRVKGIPDAALSSFVLQIKGGKDGSLLNRGALCGKRRLVKSTFAGQNGKRSYKTPLLHLAGCGKAGASARSKARRSSHAAARRAGARVSAAGASLAGARSAAAGDERAVGGRS